MIEQGKEEETLESLKVSIKHARKYGMEVILDLNPAVFEQLNISYHDLTFFKEMGATGIRLDSTFDGLVESLMTFDDSQLDLEINISNDTYYLENIISYQPNMKRIIGCHNFYPQRFTGLDYDYFIKCSKKYKEKELRKFASEGKDKLWLQKSHYYDVSLRAVIYCGHRYSIFQYEALHTKCYCCRPGGENLQDKC